MVLRTLRPTALLCLVLAGPGESLHGLRDHGALTAERAEGTEFLGVFPVSSVTSAADLRVLAARSDLRRGLLAACAASAPGQTEAEWAVQRARMVETQIRLRGVADERVLRAMLKVPRHAFMPEERRRYAYEDHPTPIGLGQTISQPFIVAYMTEALRLAPTDRVLEIGTGSGYQAAVLAEIAREVYSMEIIPELAERARHTLESLGYRNVRVRSGNGYLGWPEAAPFDKIIVTAAPDEVPKALVDQLGPNGTMIVPVGVIEQMMTIIRRTPQGLVQRETIPVLFVPMTGKPKK